MSLFDLLVAPCWLIATILLVRASARVSKRLRPRADLFGRALDSLVLGWAAIVLASFALSAFRLLLPGLLLAVVGGISVFTLWAMRDNTTRASGDACATTGRASGDAYATAVDFVSASALFRGSVRPRDRRWLIGWLTFGSLGAAALALGGLLQFPSDWDALAYHIPLVDQWIRDQSLNTTHSSSWFHPANNELFGFWCVAPFSGDFLIGLQNVPGAALLGLGTHQLARLLGARTPAAHLAALAALTPQIVMRQLVDGENDVAVAGFFMAALACGLRYAFLPRASNAILWAASVGLLPGVKYYALGYAAVASAGIMALACLLRGPRRAAAAGLAALAGAGLLSGYWYARNAWLTGTPLYPQGFLGVPGNLAETFPYLRETSLLGKGDPSLTGLLVRAVWRWLGPAHCIAFLAAPLAAAAAARRAARGDKRRACSQATIAGAMLASFAVFCTTPFVVETEPGTLDMLQQGYLPARFLLCTSTLAVVALIAQIAGRPRPIAMRRIRLRSTALWIFGALALSQPRLHRLGPGEGDPLSLSLAAFDVFLLLILASEVRRAWRSPRRAKTACAAAMVFLSLAVSGLAARWHAGFADYYDRYYQTRVFGKLATGAPPARRICPLTYRPYPFLGSRRQFEVLGPVWAPTFDALSDYLMAQHPDTVVTVRQELVGPHRYDRIRDWVAEHKELFQPIDSDSRFVVYRFTP